MRRLSRRSALVLLIVTLVLSGCTREPGVVSTGAVEPPHVAPTSQSGMTGSIESSSSGPPAVSIEASAAGTAPAAQPPVLPTVAHLPRWAKKYGGIINGVRTRKRVVALTIDDGPTTRTRGLVDVLAAAGAHATFFWVGSRITTSIAEYSIAHGEELANHTWGHPNMRWLSPQKTSAQIGRASARIAQFTGSQPIWFRSPFSRLYSRELRQIKAHRLLYANFEVTAMDWKAHSTRSEVLTSIEDGLRPGGIIVMHDTRRAGVGNLAAALRLLADRGYRVVTLTTLAQMGPPITAPLVLGTAGLGR